jgi:hypothetical protein
MDLRDADVETQLRRHLAASGHRLFPAPTDLADRTRGLHRRRRRHQAAAVGLGLAAVLLFGTVPVLRGALPEVGTTDAAAPTTSAPLLKSLYDLPARGSLADDADWLAAVAGLPWTNTQIGQDADPPVESHRVLYAAEVPGGRVALVMGQEGALLSSAWFTGPSGASAEQMSQAASSVRAFPDEPVALLDAAGGAGDPAVLVVVSRPGDGIGYTAGQRVSATGALADDRVDLRVEDGTTVAAVSRPVGSLANNAVRVSRDGVEAYSVAPTLSTRAADATMAPVEVSDPRGLRSTIDESWLQTLARSALGFYGSGADGVTPVLLAAGTVTGDGDPRMAMVGLSFPSGASVVWAARYESHADGSTASMTSIDPQAAGAPLLEQTVAVRVGGGLVVSAPASAASATALTSDGTTVTTIPLVTGSGTTDLLPAPAPVAIRVRVLDAAGAVVGEAQVGGAEG